MGKATKERLFCGVFPSGILWADRGRERHGDYAELAFMPYATLKARFQADCPKELRLMIEESVLGYQAKRGQMFQTSTSGQSVILGE